MRRTGNGIVTQSEESITSMTSYRLPHYGNRSFAVALDDILPYSPSRRQILHVRSGWRLTFPSLWRSFIQLSFWTGVRMPCEKDEKRNSGMEWRIYYLYDVLPSSSPQQQILHIRSGWRLMVFLTMGADPSLTLRMTSCHPPSFSTFSWRLTANG